MKYRLKDKKLHETLDQISNGGFSKILGEHDVTPRGLIWFGENKKFAIDADYFEFEQVFDPNEWNEYPQIEPPENTYLILKEVWSEDRVEYYAVKYKNGEFYMIDKYGDETEVYMASTKYFVRGLPL